MADATRLMISAGEASGDHHAARVLQALNRGPERVTAAGMGGPALAAAGMEILVDCRDMAIVGIVEVLRHWNRIQANLARMRDHLRDTRPDVLVLVDYPDFNLKLAETARELGIPVLYYISPQVWAWRPGRIHRIARLVDMMAVVFPFEEPLYASAGVPVRYVGHPLADEVRPTALPAAVRAEFDLADDTPVVGLLPGSRRGEIERLLPLLLDTAAEVRRQRPGVRFLLPLAGTLNAAPVQAIIEAHGTPVELIEGGRVHDILPVCDCVVAASGTVTLEAAILGTPMTVVYRVNSLTYWILRALVTLEHISLVNIVAQRPVVTEFIQGRARPRLIAGEVMRLLRDEGYRTGMQSDLAAVREALGHGGTAARTAELIRELTNTTR